MPSTPKPMRRRRDESPAWLRGYVFLGSSLLIAGLFLYTHNLTVRLDRQVRAMSRVLADFCASVTFEAIESERIQVVFREVVHQIDFPVVLTDAHGRPYAWKGIGIPVDAVPLGESLEFDPENPPAEGTLSRILEISQQMDRRNPPVAMVRPGSEQVVGYVHYGESRLLRELRWVPFVEIVAFFLFITLGFLGFRSAKISEQRYIWVGMAKETAHQLGTPISSLLGWIELLRSRARPRPEAPDRVELEAAAFEETVGEMASDVERLNKVAMRFSQVGSEPQRSEQDLVPLVIQIVEYFRRRAPRLKRGVEIEERYAQSPPVDINEQLIEWVIENLMKNAFDAMSRDGGTIRVAVFPHLDGEAVELEIADTGRGMTPGEARRIFDPGYTTKQRGWGLGLTLAKRIIEEYHGGRIWVKESRPETGTTIAISLPV
jgi:signal transduction histidine kinase